MLIRLSQVKREIVDDPRYDAVGSSSLREELFNTYLKAHGETQPVASSDAKANDHVDSTHIEESAEHERKRRERKERAVKEREQRVRVERSKVEADIDRSRTGLNREGGELEFRCAACLPLPPDGCWEPLTEDLLLAQDDANGRNTRPSGTNIVKVRTGD